MSKPIVVFGTRALAELVHYYFTHDGGRQVAAFAVDAEYLKEPVFCGLPVVAHEELLEAFPPEAYELFVAIGYSKVNTLRRDKYRQVKAMGYTLPSFIHSSCVAAHAEMGDNCFLQERNVIQPKVRIGSNVLMWVGNAVGHYATIHDHVAITSHAVVCGDVTVGEGAFIGVNATIRDGIRIGAYGVIGAGATILRDTQDYEVYATAQTPLYHLKSDELKRL